MTIDELVALCDDELGFDSSDLDDLVHNLKSQEASDINNTGVRGQVEYILECLGDEAETRIRELAQ